MLVLWALIATFQILTSNAENACKSGKYETFAESSNGYCFFVLPKADYLQILYEKQPDGKYLLIYEKADEICERHQASLLTRSFLQRREVPAFLPPEHFLPPQVLAAQKVRMRLGNHVLFVGCGRNGRSNHTFKWPCKVGGKVSTSTEVMLSYTNASEVFWTRNRIWEGNELPALACFQYQTPPTTPATPVTPKVTTATFKPKPKTIPSRRTTPTPKSSKDRLRARFPEHACKFRENDNLEVPLGICVFEPPKIEYENVINEMINGTTNFHFNLVKARQICKKHSAKLLFWDISKDGAITEVVIRLKQKLKLDVPVDCYVEPGTRKVDCNKGPAAANATDFAFISQDDKFYTWSQRPYYPQYMSGLICEMRA